MWLERAFTAATIFIYLYSFEWNKSYAHKRTLTILWQSINMYNITYSIHCSTLYIYRTYYGDNADTVHNTYPILFENR